MNITTVRGSFRMEDGTPVEGSVEFLPGQLWIWNAREKKAYATLAPHVPLINGRFQVHVTGTRVMKDNYKVITPAGTFKIRVPESKQPVFLKELISKSRT